MFPLTIKFEFNERSPGNKEFLQSEDQMMPTGYYEVRGVSQGLSKKRADPDTSRFVITLPSSSAGKNILTATYNIPFKETEKVILDAHKSGGIPVISLNTGQTSVMKP